MKTTLLTAGMLIAVAISLLAQTTNEPGGILANATRALPAPVVETQSPPSGPASSNLTRSIFIAPHVSDRSISPVPGGARAEFGLQKTFFPVDVKEAGPVIITAPDGRTLAFRATFLALHDLATDQSLLIAEVTNRVGEIVATDVVIYTNAFDTLNADIRYRYTQYSLEQDIVLHEKPRMPGEFSPEHTRLEIWTEWFNSEPVSKVTQAIDLRGNDTSGLLTPSFMNDEGLDFGAMKIVTGHAFSSTAQDEQTPVGKRWVQVEGRDWLVETVDYLAVKSKLDLLPAGRRTASMNKKSSSRESLIRSLARKTAPAPKNEARMSMAKATISKEPQFVMDFVIVSSVPVPSGVISWWPAPVNTNADDAISNNDGTLQYSATNGIGKVGQAFRFNGTSARVRVPDYASLHLTNALTIETWVYPTNVSSSRGIISKWDAVGGFNQRSYDFSVYPGGQFYLLVSPGGTDTGATYVLSTNALPTNQWTHVAGTYDGSNLKVYLNGVLDGPGVYTNGIYPGTNALGIGGVIGGATGSTIVSPFTGMIDEPSIYGRALGASEILAIYNAGAAGKHNTNCVSAPTNIVAWWPGDGNGYDLAQTNFATLSGATYESAVVAQGFSFNGTNAGVTAANDNALNLASTNDDLSIEAWIKPITNATDFDVMTVVSKRYAPNSSTATGYEWFLYGGAPGFQLADSSGIPINWLTTVNLRDDGYHHVAITLDRGATNGLRFYIDGVLVGAPQNPTIVSGSLSNSEPVRIGIHPQSGANCWYKGVIDEPTIYRRALSSSEVTQLYTAGCAGKCKTDTDGDGLTDLQEDFLGTYPNDTDSDDDGLIDGDEVFVYHTKPKNDDTDGDGVNDGTEVIQGRNPLISGTVSDSGNLINFQVYTPLH